MSATRTGTSTMITEELLGRWPLPVHRGEGGKEERGHILVVGGSAQIPGAVLLAACGALRAGAGKLQIATARSVAPSVAIGMPEACVWPLAETRAGELSSRGTRSLQPRLERCEALLVGPGMCDPRAASTLMRHWAGAPQGVLIADAAALLTFAARTPLGQRGSRGLVLTPHTGEMAKMWGMTRENVQACAAEVARAAAARFNAVVALKGACTYIAAPDGTCFRNTAGNIGLGTSGSGDALAGIIAGLCARGAAPLQAAVWGVFLHARAGDQLARKLGPVGFLAREILDEIPGLMHRLGSQAARGRTRRVARS